MSDVTDAKPPVGRGWPRSDHCYSQAASSLRPTHIRKHGMLAGREAQYNRLLAEDRRGPHPGSSKDSIIGRMSFFLPELGYYYAQVSRTLVRAWKRHGAFKPLDCKS